jgi:DNA mismatch endonuclease (patch repair protein)
MADVVDPATRSRMMAGIRGRNTTPEILLRRRLHCEGFRFRLHVAGLPGRPDIVLPGRRIAILVHGCYWHRHEGCHWSTTPASNMNFWGAKFARNRERDAEVMAALRETGWRVATVWECGLRSASIDETVRALIDWIRSDSPIFESGVVRRRRASDQDEIFL